MLDKIKKAIGIGSVAIVTGMAPGVSEGKVAHEQMFLEENSAVKSIDDVIYIERATALDAVINEKFKQKILETGIERIQVLIGKEDGEEKGVFQVNFGNFVSDNGREIFDIIHTVTVDVDGATLLNKYASEELLSGVVAQELEELAKRSPKEGD